MSTASDWNAQRAADRAAVGESYYSADQLLEQHIAEKMAAAQAQAAQARAEFVASPQGHLAGLELEMAEIAAQMPEAAWQAMWAEKGEPAPRKPQEQDLPLSSRNRLLQGRVNQILAERTKGNR